MFEDVLRRAVAGFIGRFTLIFIGCGSIVAANSIHDSALLGIAIARLRPLARPEPVGPSETGVREPRPGDAAAS